MQFCAKSWTLFTGQGLPPKNIFLQFNKHWYKLEKNVRIFWGGSVTTKTPIFRDPCFGSFSDEAPENGRHKTHNEDPRPQPISSYNHVPNIALIARCELVRLTDQHTNTQIHIIIKESCARVEISFFEIVNKLTLYSFLGKIYIYNNNNNKTKTVQNLFVDLEQVFFLTEEHLITLTHQ